MTAVYRVASGPDLGGLADGPTVPQTGIAQDGGQALFQGYHDLVRRDVFPLVPASSSVALDLGGGVGATVGALKADGRVQRAVLADLVADQPHPMIDRAFAGNLEDAAFLAEIIAAEGPFDLILCLDVLEHLRDPWAVVAALHQGLKPGGVIVASLPNARNVELVWNLVVRGDFPLADKGILDRTHLRWFTRKTAIELMTSSGLDLEDVIDKNMGGRRHMIYRRLGMGLLNRFLDLQYLIRVRRTGRD